MAKRFGWGVLVLCLFAAVAVATYFICTSQYGLITKLQFGRVEDGMTVAEVNGIFRTPPFSAIPIKEVPGTICYEWRGVFGSVRMLISEKKGVWYKEFHADESIVW